MGLGNWGVDSVVISCLELLLSFKPFIKYYDLPWTFVRCSNLVRTFVRELHIPRTVLRYSHMPGTFVRCSHLLRTFVRDVHLPRTFTTYAKDVCKMI